MPVSILLHSNPEPAMNWTRLRSTFNTALLAATWVAAASATTVARADAGTTTDAATLAQQAALAQIRAESSFNALSDRYTEIWARLPSADKTRFSAQERAWLNDGRWQEQRACVAALGGEPNAFVQARCQAAVIERRLAQLAGLALARL